MPVKFIESDRNVGLLRALLAEVNGRGHLRDRAQCVPYRSCDAVRALRRGARVVITDLEHFSQLARASGVKVVERRSLRARRSRAWALHEFSIKKADPV